jgi:hypothetical protein
MNYHNRKFKPVSNSENGAVSDDMTFHYQQDGKVLFCDYSGKNIVKGQLIGLVDDHGKIDMRYHQIHFDGAIMTGICASNPELMPNGKIRLHESWQWTSGDESKGTSLLEEI